MALEIKGGYCPIISDGNPAQGTGTAWLVRSVHTIHLLMAFIRRSALGRESSLTCAFGLSTLLHDHRCAGKWSQNTFSQAGSGLDPTRMCRHEQISLRIHTHTCTCETRTPLVTPCIRNHTSVHMQNTHALSHTVHPQPHCSTPSYALMHPNLEEASGADTV